MLTRVEARSSSGDILTMSMDDVTQGYVLAKIEGLDPVKANIVSTSFAQLDGTQYQTSRRESRDIKLQIELEPDYVNTTVTQLRSDLYLYFMPRREVTLTFTDSSGRNVQIAGRIESFDSELFSKEPTIDISIMCFDPDFVDLVPGSQNATSSTTVESMIDYKGSVATGMTFAYTATRAVTGFSIYFRAGSSKINTFEFQMALLAGDRVTISSVVGSKGVTLQRGTTVSNILYAMSPISPWPVIQPGDNYFRLDDAVGGNPYIMAWETRYGGL